MKGHIEDAEPRLVVVDPGHKVEHRGKNSYTKKTITVGRKWDVYVGDEKIGQVVYRMFTREQRTPGRRYVNSRWQSPGWGYSSGTSWREFEAYSKKDAIQNVVRDYERRKENR